MVNKRTKKNTPMISDFHYNVIMKNADRLNSAIIYDRDFGYNYFGFKVRIYGCLWLMYEIKTSLIHHDGFTDIRKIIFAKNQ